MGNGDGASCRSSELAIGLSTILRAPITTHPSTTRLRGGRAHQGSQAGVQRHMGLLVLVPKALRSKYEIVLHLLDGSIALITGLRSVTGQGQLHRGCREVVSSLLGASIRGKQVSPLMLCPQAGCSTDFMPLPCNLPLDLT